jgi:histidyl-tRNA synthetase
MKLLEELRRQNIPADIELSERSLNAQMRQVNKSGARFSVIVGEHEGAPWVVGLRDMQKKEQQEMNLFLEEMPIHLVVYEIIKRMKNIEKREE